MEGIMWGLIVGLLVGVPVGAGVICLCVISRWADDSIDADANRDAGTKGRIL